MRVSVERTHLKLLTVSLSVRQIAVFFGVPGDDLSGALHLPSLLLLHLLSLCIVYGLFWQFRKIEMVIT